MLDVEFAQLTDAGRRRDNNEDFLGHVAPATPERVQSHGWLFALADGLGGHQQGEVAARIAVEHLLAGFQKAPAGESHNSLLPDLVQQANALVYQAGRKSARGGASMATTLVACALRFDRAVIAHAGDSRCYLIRRGQAIALTRDHTLVNEQLRLGLLSPREDGRSLAGHLLTRSIGNDLIVAVETTEHLVFPDDVLLLCSDGLHGPISESEMAQTVAGHRDLHAAAQALITLANQRDGSDNISVQLIRVRNVERVGMYRGRPYKL